MFSFHSTSGNIQLVGRIVFGEARGESYQGQLAVAWTVVNRVNSRYYPNTVTGVVNQKYGSHHQYNTLDVHRHDEDWARAKAGHTDTYRVAIKAATDALCNNAPDPTGCATAYCAYDPCSATNDTPFTRAYNKIRIGHHYFVCQGPK